MEQIQTQVEAFTKIPIGAICDTCGEPVDDTNAAPYEGGWVVCDYCARLERWPWDDDIPHRNGDHQCAEETIYSDDPRRFAVVIGEVNPH